MKSLPITIFISFLICLSCKTPETPEVPDPPAKFELLNSYLLSIPEPSGLSIGTNGDQLWVVSDKSKKVYQLSITGDIIDSLSYKGDDLEGITYNKSDQTFWVVEEKYGSLLHLNREGSVLETFFPSLPQTEVDKGLEGISIDPQGGNLFVLIEDKPGTLIQFNLDGEIQKEVPLNFAKDYSGIFFDEENQNLWIISDQSESLSKCSIDGVVEESFDLGIPKAEGIAIDFDAKRIYIVSDSEEILYVFQLPG